LSSPTTPRDLSGLRESDPLTVAAAGITPEARNVLFPEPHPVNSRHLPLPPEAADDAEALTERTQLSFEEGRFDDTFQTGRQALARWHTLQQHARSCEVLHLMALSCLEHEQGIESLALARHAFRLARARLLPASLVHTLSLLGVLHARLHEPVVGEELAMQALSRARDLNKRPVLGQALHALLSVQLGAFEAQRLAQDAPSMQATVQRMQRHAVQALAQSGPLPTDFEELQLRVQAAAALSVCNRCAEALPVLNECIEWARHRGYRVVGMWARHFEAQANLQTNNTAAAQAGTQMLASLLRSDDPPRLRLATLKLQMEVAKRGGATDLALELDTSSGVLQENLLRQRFKLRSTYKRNAEDVMQALSVIDREWQELGVAVGSSVDPAAT
jgi:hypothetical protein